MYLFCLLTFLLNSCVPFIDAPPDYSLNEKIGQMIMVGFVGTEPQNNQHLLRDISEYDIGGVIFFNKYKTENDRPVVPVDFQAQLQTSISFLRASAKTPLFVAIDQEGGNVSRLKEEHGFPPTVSAQFLGTENNLETTYAYAQTSASILRQLGININLAPVVDLNSNPDNPVIGMMERSYSSDPEIVVQHAEQFINAHREEGILCVLKHFPGHGSSSTDSHVDSVDVSRSWRPAELVPFQKLIEAGKADAIMTAHIFNSRIDDEKPATLSSKCINDLLRSELNFKGLVITDDLLMSAMKDNYHFSNTIIDSVNAGADILLFSKNHNNVVPKTIRIIEQGVRSKQIDMERIEEAFTRIMKLKRHYLKAG